MQSLMLELLPWVRQGQCCSQLLLLLAQQYVGREVPEVVSAARGLCFGLGDGNGPCGLLTGGACALSFIAGGKETMGDEKFLPMLQDYTLWFEEEAAPQGVRCQDITGVAPGAGQPDLMACGDLLASCWGKILELVQTYGVDAS